MSAGLCCLGAACSPRALSHAEPERDAERDLPADTASSGDDGGGSDVSTLDGSIPTKDGVPIGDCVEPTPAELAALRCPATEPQQESSCDSSAALRCRFAISTRNGYASQDVLQCAPSNSPTSFGAMKWFGARVTCGRTCELPASNAIALVAADCEGRTVVSCRGDLEEKGAVFSAESTAQDLLDAELAAAVFACAKGDVFNELIEVGVASGCPRTLAVPAGFDPSLAACVKARLERTRWDCALALACGSYQRILL
ncbi:MAG: hypothetical protein JWM82_3809 [Myxococcales bacterium]|nr:hypothetical protein [Myxococcales bacterium]